MLVGTYIVGCDPHNCFLGHGLVRIPKVLPHRVLRQVIVGEIEQLQIFQLIEVLGQPVESIHAQIQMAQMFELKPNIEAEMGYTVGKLTTWILAGISSIWLLKQFNNVNCFKSPIAKVRFLEKIQINKKKNKKRGFEKNQK